MTSTPIVYVTMPTALAAHAQETFAKWKAKGYKLALFTDAGKHPPEADLLISATYPGVWRACNALAKAAVECGADVCLFAGDDMDPDQNYTAQEIAEQYLGRFPTGAGLMQPCGDPQGQLIDGKRNAARICGSAWFGKEWIEKSYGGRGPTPGMYWHMFGDEEMAEVGNKLGLLWWRPDLTQWHRHWSFRGGTPKQPYHDAANSHWTADQDTFKRRKAEGFPGVWK